MKNKKNSLGNVSWPELKAHLLEIYAVMKSIDTSKDLIKHRKTPSSLKVKKRK